LLAVDRAIDGVDQRLRLDELDAGPLGLVAIEGCCQHLGERVAIVGHTIARLFQCFQSLAHLDFTF
jgi:hypothetical protein